MARRPRKKKLSGFEESQAPFTPAPLDLNAVYAAYGHRCAFTGTDLSREAAADPLGWLLRVGPRDADLIPAATDAIYAYERGHLAIGPRYNFLADLEVIAPELLERLNPIGRLTVPRSRRLRPSLRALRAHRGKLAAGKFKA